MKNSTKALIAGGVGAALLLGGAGTIAYWTDEADGGDGTITAGSLEIGTVIGGGWQISHQGDGTGTPTDPVDFDPVTDQIVPGDLLSYTQSIPVTLVGENIAATFDGVIDVSATGTEPENEALAAAIVGEDLATTGLTGATGELTLDPDTDVLTGEGDGTVDVTTTITFPWGDAGEFNPAQLGSLDFSVDYTLTQTPAN